MFWGVMELDPFHETFGFLLAKHLLKRTLIMGVQVIANDVDGLCLFVRFLNKSLHKHGEIFLCSTQGNGDDALASFWLDGTKDIFCSIAMVLVRPFSNYQLDV